MVTAKRKVSRRKKAEVGINLQPPKHLGDKVASPTTREESTLGDAELQEKMREAATKFVDLARTLWDALDDPNMEDLSEHIASYRIFEPHVYCTPVAVLFRLGDEWIKLTAENVKEAFERISERNAIGNLSTVLADEHLALARTVCKERGRVSWVLPRLETEDQEVAK